jgi:putative OPT family oligopeptide transporter
MQESKSQESTIQQIKIQEPLISASTKLPEMTVRVIIFSIILAAILAASDAYLALKIGTTIAASIPAAVLAMGILRFFKNSNVLESNMIQTAASAGEGVAAAMAFTLPALVITHAWNSFPYWETVLITITGGILGVLFSVPLRRILFNIPTLRFPEGTAVGNVLKVSATGGKHLKYLVQGASAGGIISLIQSGFKIIGDELDAWAYVGKTVFGMSISFEPALIAAGYIVGIQVGVSFLVGIIVGWGIVLPGIAFLHGVPHAASAFDSVMTIWSNQSRYVGVGVLLVGGVWTLITLLRPVINGFKESIAASKRTHVKTGVKLLRTERDIPFSWIVIISSAAAIVIFAIIFEAMAHAGLNYSNIHLLFVSLATVLFIFVAGFLLSTLCGYFAGLIGSTNSPLSGMIIITILLLGSLFLLMFKGQDIVEIGKLVTIILIITAVVTALPSISLENIQDLKSGQMVGATPWKQQIILILGIICSALVIGPVLNLLFNAYGMGGVFPRPGMDPSQMLAAPQANLMATIAKGVLMRDINWSMVGLGAIIAVLGIIVDEILKRRGKRFIVLGMGLGIYLPVSIVSSLFIGSLISYLAKRGAKKENESQSGTLLACGIVAGNALMGVILAIPFVALGSSDALALVSAHFAPIATVIGAVVTILVCYWLYKASVKTEE